MDKKYDMNNKHKHNHFQNLIKKKKTFTSVVRVLFLVWIRVFTNKNGRETEKKIKIEVVYLLI